MVAGSYAHHCQQSIENILSESSVRLAVVDQHLFENLLSCNAAKAARLGPRLIDYAVASHSIGR